MSSREWPRGGGSARATIVLAGDASMYNYAGEGGSRAVGHMYTEPSLYFVVSSAATAPPAPLPPTLFRYATPVDAIVQSVLPLSPSQRSTRRQLLAFFDTMLHTSPSPLPPLPHVSPLLPLPPCASVPEPVVKSRGSTWPQGPDGRGGGGKRKVNGGFEHTLTSGHYA